MRITFVPTSADGMFGNVEIEAFGPWVDTILWEVPLMASLSESYFESVMTDWNYDNQGGQLSTYDITSGFILIYSFQ